MTFLLPAGDWMAEARIGATDMLDRIARLPGLLETYLLFFSDPNLFTPSSQACLHFRTPSDGVLMVQSQV